MRKLLRTAAVGMAAAMAATALAGPARATVDVTGIRYQGDDRFETAAFMAFSAPPTTTAIIARGDQFADALAGAYLAGATKSVLLLTRSDSLPEVTRDVLDFMGITDVTLLGGTSAITPSVEAQLRPLGVRVTRVAGSDRYETARAAAALPGQNVGLLNGKRTALLASGLNFPDALAAGPIAAGARLPLLLTNPNGLSDAARRSLQELAIEQVVVLGGPAALSTAVESQVAALSGMSVTRVAGADRGATSVALAKLARTSLGFSTTRLGFARGDAFADALAYAPLAGSDRGGRNALELTTSPTVVGDAVLADVRDLSTSLVRLEVAGGPSAVSTAVAEQLLTAARGTAGPVVALPVTSTPAGGTLTGTVNGNDIGDLSVSGCGIATQQLRSGPGSFTVTIPAAQATGPCTLSFTVGSSAGQAPVTLQRAITVGAAPAPAPQLKTAAPDLTGAEVVAGVAGDGQPNTVRFTFDSPVASPASTLLSLVGYDSSARLGAISAVVDPASSSAVIASFPDAAAVTGATLAVAGPGAVSDASARKSPLGSAPLKGTIFVPGRTSLPELVSATPQTVSDRVTYVFDQAVTEPDSSYFGFYDTAGALFNGTSIVSQPTASSVVVQFSSSVTQAVRFATDFGAVFDDQGNPNPEASVGALTGAPDLIAVQRVQGSTTVFDYVFDDVVSTATPDFDAGWFTLYTDDGRYVSGEIASQPSEKVIRITFPADANHDRRGVAASAGARATARPSDSRGSTMGLAVFAPAGFGSNLSDGPDLLGASYDSTGDKITYTFDDLIDVVNQAPDASKLFAVKTDGTAVAGTAVVSVNGPQVTISFPSGTVASAAGAAATSGVEVGSGAGSAVGDAALDRATPPGFGNPNSPGSVGGGPAVAA